MNKLVLILAFALSHAFSGNCSNTSDSINSRKKLVIVGNSVGYVAAMTGMYTLWYKDYPLTKFHFHNDNAEFFKMDKVGHAYSCYYEGVVGIDQLQWAGFSRKKSIIIGGMYGLFIQSSVEVFDGFSEEWGASPGDIMANIAGAGLAIGQALAWDEQRLWMKVSVNPSTYPQIRPELLGKNKVESIFKDYNAQTYWLSGNLKSFMKTESKFPAWLNVAFGYGIDGFVGGDDNIFERDGITYDYSNIARVHQLYLAPDIDLTRIPVNRKSLKIAFRILNCLKFPLPTLGYNPQQRSLSFHALGF